VTYLFLLLAGAVALVMSLTGSLSVALLSGIALLAISLVILLLIGRRGPSDAENSVDAGRRRFLGWMAVAGVLVVTGGAGIGRLIRRVTKTDPMPAVRGMAETLCAPASGPLQGPPVAHVVHLLALRRVQGLFP